MRKLLNSAWPFLLLYSARPTTAGRRHLQPTFQSPFTTRVLSISFCKANCRRRSLPSIHNNIPSKSRLQHYSSNNSGTKSTTGLSSSSSSEQLKTLQGNDIYAAEEVIKKSRFIGFASHCTNWDDAQILLQNIRNDHPKARHVCFGFVSSSGATGSSEGGGSGTERCSDDGEPTGTAGVPILGAIKGEGLSDVVCAVVRYSGGIKLGAGGLIRAYGGTGRLVLRSAPVEVHVPKRTMRIATRTANSGAVYAASAKFGGVTSGESYNDRGELEVAIVCDEENGDRLKEALVDGTRGGIMFL